MLVQAFTKVPLPETIDRHAGKQRVFRRRQPIGKSFQPAFPEIDPGGCEWPAGLHLLVFLGSLRIPTGQDVALLQFPFSVDLHGPEGRKFAATPSAETASHLVELLLQLVVFLANLLRHYFLYLVRVDPQYRKIIV